MILVLVEDSKDFGSALDASVVVEVKHEENHSCPDESVLYFKSATCS